jgi:hypothetical protein
MCISLPMKLKSLLHLSVLAVASATLLPSDAIAGRKSVSQSRPESSYRNVFVSPDKKVRAAVFFPDESIRSLRDMESRVVLICNSPPCEPYSGTVRGAGEIMASQDFSSASGMNAYFVSRGKWSPDSEFFVFTLTSSGGHSPWHRPIGV